ncbi:non-hydrolyzing UDP-N-acetylglucosamine 2-epimerase [Pseudomonadota bacterium]
MKSKVVLVIGARPNYIKAAPIVWSLARYKKSIEVVLIDTRQHYDPKMSKHFALDLNLPEPDFSLETTMLAASDRMNSIEKRLVAFFSELSPQFVTVFGDVDSTAAAALAAAQCGIGVGHVEAGLRSFDNDMPEETNRIATDRVSTLLFASEPAGVVNLERENFDPDSIFLSGNVMIDTLKANHSKIVTNNFYSTLNIRKKKYGLVTLHRGFNVDDPKHLQFAIQVLREATLIGDVVFPIHPRTAKNLKHFELEQEFASLGNLHVTPPLRYMEFLNLMAHAAYVLTDSGGVQEETTWLGVPCLTLRKSTERPITIELGTNKLLEPNLQSIRSSIDRAFYWDVDDYQPPALWDGNAGHRIVNQIYSHLC